MEEDRGLRHDRQEGPEGITKSSRGEGLVLIRDGTAERGGTQ